MNKLRFRDMPMIVRVTSAASILAAWVLFEQIVIEPFGIYRFMPFYRYGKFCTYDAAAVLLVLIYWIVAHRSNGPRSEALLNSRSRASHLASAPGAGEHSTLSGH
jgi:hypothetical protein